MAEFFVVVVTGFIIPLTSLNHFYLFEFIISFCYNLLAISAIRCVIETVLGKVIFAILVA